MGIRTKMIVTVASVATMTAIGTTKAYATEVNKMDAVNNKKQIIINEKNKKQNINLDKQNNNDKEIIKQHKYKVNLNKDQELKLKVISKKTNISNGQVINVSTHLNVRDGASDNAKIIGTLKNKEEVKIDNNYNDKDWYNIYFGDHGGFVSSHYIKNNNISKDIKKETNDEVKKNEVKKIEKTENKKPNIKEGKIVNISTHLNIRQDANTKSKIIGSLKDGEKVKINSDYKNNDWYNIYFGKNTGFISSNYVNVVEKNETNKDKIDNKIDTTKEHIKEITVEHKNSDILYGEIVNISSHLNVRRGPDRDNKIIGELKNGSIIKINKQEDTKEWYSIDFGKDKGYIYSKYVKVTGEANLISNKLAGFVASYEGYSATPYRGADYQNRTIGYGHVILPGETYNNLTERQAKELLKNDLIETAVKVKKVLKNKDVKLNSQNKFDALVSFSFNCGVKALSDSRLLKDIKNGANVNEVKDAFLAWSYCNGVRLEGLKRRRLEEWQMYTFDDYIRNY